MSSPPVRGVIFDLDGTLVRTHLDYEAMRREIGVPAGTPLLEAVDRLDGPAKVRALDVLHRHESAAARAAEVHHGVVECLAWLDARGLRRGVLSRNCRAAVFHALETCGLRFDPVLAREDAPYKPSPEGIWAICRGWGFDPAEVVMVGDYAFDIQAGRNAGARTALITHGRSWAFAGQADVAFEGFPALPGVLESWLAGRGPTALPARPGGVI